MDTKIARCEMLMMESGLFVLASLGLGDLLLFGAPV